MRVNKLIALATTAVLICGGAAQAKVKAKTKEYRDSAKPAVLSQRRDRAPVVIAAYQQPYAMNFEIWQPDGLAIGWYATFDGFPVAQVAANRWVYGQVGLDGALIPTNILVGSVVPSEVPGLGRVAATWLYSSYINDPEFCKVLSLGCDRMAFLRDPLIRTAVAWKSGEPGLYVWLGTRWKKYLPSNGESAGALLIRNRDWISRELRKCDYWLLGDDPSDLADLARQWGILWCGGVDTRWADRKMPAGDVGGGDGYSGGSGSVGAVSAGDSEETDDTPGWDTD